LACAVGQPRALIHRYPSFLGFAGRASDIPFNEGGLLMRIFSRRALAVTATVAALLSAQAITASPADAAWGHGGGFGGGGFHGGGFGGGFHGGYGGGFHGGYAGGWHGGWGGWHGGWYHAGWYHGWYGRPWGYPGYYGYVAPPVVYAAPAPGIAITIP
jgi:hypothetical protein